MKEHRKKEEIKEEKIESPDENQEYNDVRNEGR